MTDTIRITKTTAKKDKPKDKDLAFGKVFTDHMFIANFQEEKGWYDPRVEPYAPFPSKRWDCWMISGTSADTSGME